MAPQKSVELEKQPIVGASFRMAIEKMITKFSENDEEQLEFPASLSKDQRNFISNYVFKIGLKSKCIGKGEKTRSKEFN
jgi:hypothetical protein